DDAVMWVNAAGQPMGKQYLRSGWRSNERVVAYDFAQVNHYAVKSRAEFLLKRARGTANSSDKGRIDLSYWERFDLNAHEDNTIRSGDLDGRLDALRRDADLAALERAARDVAARTIALQMEDAELRAFVETGEVPTAEAQPR
ncbi:MAG: glycosyltransferase family 2 protein, partial [Pseudomonadota bacterium]